LIMRYFCIEAIQCNCLSLPGRGAHLRIQDPAATFHRRRSCWTLNL
jgi:hypothetical protein